MPAAPSTEEPPPGLYIVATPIGNLGDISARALAVLRVAAAVACEDTRVTGRLLAHFAIKARLIRYDDHSDAAARERILALARQSAVALVSDAGTPLISDPGYQLIRAARAAGVMVTSIPGPSALIAALTLAGLPTDRFLFAGFLPTRASARAAALGELATVPATLVFYEAAPRLGASLAAIGAALPGREIAVARELTKIYEECRSGLAEALISHYSRQPPRGEIVLVVAPPPASAPDMAKAATMLHDALQTMRPAQAASQVARATGVDRKTLYALALARK